MYRVALWPILVVMGMMLLSTTARTVSASDPYIEISSGLCTPGSPGCEDGVTEQTLGAALACLFSDPKSKCLERVGEAIADAGRWVGNAAADAGRWVGNAVVDAGRWVGNAVVDAGRWVGETLWNAAKVVFRPWCWFGGCGGGPSAEQIAAINREAADLRNRVRQNVRTRNTVKTDQELLREKLQQTTELRDKANTQASRLGSAVLNGNWAAKIASLTADLNRPLSGTDALEYAGSAMTRSLVLPDPAHHEAFDDFATPKGTDEWRKLVSANRYKRAAEQFVANAPTDVDKRVSLLAMADLAITAADISYSQGQLYNGDTILGTAYSLVDAVFDFVVDKVMAGTNLVAGVLNGTFGLAVGPSEGYEEYFYAGQAIGVDVKDSAPAQLLRGLVAGGLAGATPGGFTIGIAGEISGISKDFPAAFRLGYGIGEAAWGLAQIIAGGSGEIGGVALDLTGFGAAVGVPLNVAFATAIAEGAADISTGLGVVMSVADELPEGTHSVRDTPDASTIESNSESEILAEALERSGNPRPPNHEAHHIVAASDSRAERAAEILQEVGIGINEAPNGVWLPRVARGSETTSGITSQAFTSHDSLHTTAYYEAVTARLETARKGGKEAVLRALAAIREILENDGTL